MRFLPLSALVPVFMLLACGGASGSDAGAVGGGSGGGSAGGGSVASGGGGSGGGGAPGAELGASCAGSTECNSGFCVDGVCCNSACTGSCEACSTVRTNALNGVCAPVVNGQVCRASAGACDVAEVCTNGVCGADAFIDAGATCRPSTGVCDVAEVCSGAEASCPGDVMSDAGTVCHASTGACDPAETCSGASGSCPQDERAAAGTLCRPAAEGCDLEEQCDGTSSQCPADLLSDAGVVCRASAGTCDVAEVCSGTTPACPVDTFVPPTSLACAPYKCTGSAAACTVTCANTSADCAPDQRSFCNVSVCETGRLVFATSTTRNSNFGAGTVGGGVVKGDAECQALAADAGRGGTFRAWISDPTSFPSQRFTRDGGAWIRTDKAIVARDWADLTDGTIGAPINRNERGAAVTFATAGVLTGTTITGTSATFGGGQTNTHCVGWASAAGVNQGTRGDGTQSTAAWTNASNAPCGGLTGARLYCFQQD